MLLSDFEYSRGSLVALTLLALHIKFGAFGLVTNDGTICTKQTRRPATRYVSYRETYKPYYWKPLILTRWNYRIERYIELEVVNVCCDGYESHSLLNMDEDLTCMPVCKSGCTNGKCHKPGVCLCDEGYEEGSQDIFTGERRCEPVCSSGCHGGRCVAPRTCVCDAGYRLAADGGSCAPVCSSGCHGGRCVAPRTCVCDAGYRLAADGGSCEASCSSISIGGQPECGSNGSCIGPNVCECSEGYIAVRNSSLSNGDSTQNSVGVRTSEWTLTTTPKTIHGRTFHSSDVTCQASCDPECGKNATCEAPNECKCRAGYSRASITTEETSNNSLCLPVCEKECVNGFCGYPNRCICNSGYKLDATGADSSICKPICKDDCVNGICTLPDHCQCNAGFEKLSARIHNDSASGNVCVPVCPGQCLNGCCVAPGYCLCDPGYVLTLVYTNDTANELADGIDNDDYIGINPQQSCRPLCQPSCNNGSICIAPNLCETLRQRDPNEFATNRTENIVSVGNCSGNGAFQETNGSCSCFYGWTGFACEEPSICAIALSDFNGRDENYTLQSVDVHYYNGTVTINYSINSGESNGNSWEILKCKEECRSSVMAMKNSSNDATIYPCQRAQFSIETPEESGENETVICFMEIGSPCNLEQARSVTGKIGIAVLGYFILSAVVVFLGSASIFFVHRKFKRMKALRAVQRINTMRELAEATEALYATDDSSHQ